MEKRVKHPEVADPQLQLALENLSELKSMDNEIWPTKKPPRALETEAASLVVSKGLHVVDAPRRKA